MIEIRYKAEFDSSGPPFVVKMVSSHADDRAIRGQPDVAIYKVEADRKYVCKSEHGDFSYYQTQLDAIEGDVFLCFPSVGRIERLFRANSDNNTFLFTERCDQMCLMCSQPPRNTDDEWRFPLYKKALFLVPPSVRIGISGGEPTLFKEDLFSLLELAATHRPDLSFHILSNGQHFEASDRRRLTDIHEKLDVLWGIPLYAPTAELHEKIVDKAGAFDRVMENLYVLASTHANIELRTVLMLLNATELPNLAVFIADHLSFISFWAIMAMEPIGFAKANKDGLFFDHSIAPHPIHQVLSFPIRDTFCTVPAVRLANSTERKVK